MNDADLPPLLLIRPGFYRHYKGGLYQVLAGVRHSESLEAMTLYRACYGAHGLWVRPSAMFLEQIVWQGVQQPRFAWLSARPPDGAVPPDPLPQPLT
jgi:hypothetical protein